MFHSNNSAIHLKLTKEQFKKLVGDGRHGCRLYKAQIGGFEFQAYLINIDERFPPTNPPYVYEVDLNVVVEELKSEQESLAEKSVKEARKALEAAEEVLKKIQSEKGK